MVASGTQTGKPGAEAALGGNGKYGFGLERNSIHLSALSFTVLFTIFTPFF